MFPIGHIKRNLPDGIIVTLGPAVNNSRDVALFIPKGKLSITKLTVGHQALARQGVNDMNGRLAIRFPATGTGGRLFRHVIL